MFLHVINSMNIETSPLGCVSAATILVKEDAQDQGIDVAMEGAMHAGNVHGEVIVIVHVTHTMNTETMLQACVNHVIMHVKTDVQDQVTYSDLVDVTLAEVALGR